jgi:hypothetical protein
MTITRGIATAAMLAVLAAGTASTAWADTTMSGHYIVTNTSPAGITYNDDWYFTPCGDGCADWSAPAYSSSGRAQLVNGQWTMNANANAVCDDNTHVPNALGSQYIWDPNTLAGTVVATTNVPACGKPAGYQQTNTIQLRQAP